MKSSIASLGGGAMFCGLEVREVRFGVVVLMAVRWGLSHVSLHAFHM
jgi:hypothetical protein